MPALTELFVKIGADTGEAIAGLESVARTTRRIAGDLTAFGATLSAAVSAPIGAIAKLGADFALLQQRATLAFTAMTGSAESAEQALEDVQQVANRLGASSRDLLPLAQRLAGVGIAARDVAPAVQAIVDTVARFGGSRAEIERVTMAITQMLGKGRVSAEEMTQQLGEVFPAWQMLSRATGKSVAALQQMAEKGQLDAAQTVRSLLQQMARESSGMGEQVGTMLPGQLQKLQNAAEQAFGALMSPALEVAARAIGGLVPMVQALAQAIQQLDPQTRLMIVGIGAVLAAAGPLALAIGGIGLALSALLSPIGLVATAITGLAVAAGVAAVAFLTNWNGIRDRFGPVLQEVASTVGRFATTMLEWGVNLMVAFANGMAIGVRAVVTVLNELARIVAFFLRPGSPPRLLPEIDRWGALTMQEYLQGWTKADFGVFSELSRLIEDRLRVVTRLTGEPLPDLLFGSRGALVQAVTEMRELGRVSEETLEAIRQAAGSAGDEIAGIIDVYAQWARAGEDVTRLQRELAQINRQFAAELRPLQAELDAINRRQQEIDDQQRIARMHEQVLRGKADPKELELLVREVELRRQIREVQGRQREAVDAKQAELDAAEALRDALAPQIEAFRQMNEWQQGTVRLLDEFTKSAGGAASATAGISAHIADLQLNLPAIAADTNTIATAFRQIEDAVKPLLTLIDALNAGVQNPFADIAASFQSLVDNLQKLQREGTRVGAPATDQNPLLQFFAGLGVAQPLGGLGTAGAILGGWVGGLADALGRLVSTIWTSVEPALQQFAALLGATVSTQLYQMGIALGLLIRTGIDVVTFALIELDKTVKMIDATLRGDHLAVIRAVKEAEEERTAVFDRSRRVVEDSIVATQGANAALIEFMHTLRAASRQPKPETAPDERTLAVAPTGPEGEAGPYLIGTRATARQHGGPIWPQETYLWNEGGRGELLIPRRPGYIVPHQGNVITVGAGAFPITIQATGNDLRDAEALAAAVLDRINLALRGMAVA
ncbi:MAG: hypothetical protein KatS3mg060_1162 [Dehalococcoidia bacterium]|nr:MAG: hypothetical protein KatS3mg060_1162 [Dehalococcoidia bacterium]